MVKLKREFGFLVLAAMLFGFEPMTGKARPISIQPIHWNEPKPSDTFMKGDPSCRSAGRAARRRGFYNPVSGRWMHARVGKPPVRA